MNKIQALEKTIYNLENDVYEYSWSNPNSCNCGVLAHALLGKRPSEAGLYNSPLRDNSEKGAFAGVAFCMTSNMPLPEIFSSLKEAGFSFQDLKELEFLANPHIRMRAGMGDSRFDFNEKGSLITYLKAWV